MNSNHGNYGGIHPQNVSFDEDMNPSGHFQPVNNTVSFQPRWDRNHPPNYPSQFQNNNRFQDHNRPQQSIHGLVTDQRFLQPTVLNIPNNLPSGWGSTFPSSNVLPSNNYQNNLAENYPTQHVSKSVNENSFDCSSQKLSDCNAWLNQWKLRTSHSISETCQTVSKVKSNASLNLDKVSKDVLHMKSLIEDSTINIQLLKDGVTVKDGADIVKSIQMFLSELEQLKNKMNCEPYITTVKHLIKARRKKRSQGRQRKKVIRATHKRKIELRKMKDDEINAWMQQITQEEKEKRQNSILKKEADCILEEVHKKIQDNKNMSRILDVILLLRETRLKKGETHGFITTPEVTSIVKSNIEKLKSLLNKQDKQYALEKQALSVMMAENISSSKGNIITKGHSSLCSKLEKETSLDLFGCNETEMTNKSTKINTTEQLVDIRCDWDRYICSAQNPLGSFIPLSWVLPSTNPNSDWEGFQHTLENNNI